MIDRPPSEAARKLANEARNYAGGSATHAAYARRDRLARAIDALLLDQRREPEREFLKQAEAIVLNTLNEQCSRSDVIAALRSAFAEKEK